MSPRATLFVIFAQKTALMEQEPKLNEHNKQEYPPMHTAELYTY